MSTNAFDLEIERFGDGLGVVDAFAVERQARKLQALYLRDATRRGAARLARGIGTLGQRLRSHLARREALAQLHRLDDRLLADIGLSRGNLLGQLLRAEASQAPQSGGVERIVGTASGLGSAANVNRSTRAA